MLLVPVNVILCTIIFGLVATAATTGTALEAENCVAVVDADDAGLKALGTCRGAELRSPVPDLEFNG